GVAQALRSNEMQTITTKVSQNLTAVMNSEFLQDLRANLEASQVIELVSDTSVTLTNLSQNSILTIAQQFVTDNEVATNAFGEETFNVISNIANQQNTLDSLGKAVFQSTLPFADAISSSVGIVCL